MKAEIMDTDLQVTILQSFYNVLLDTLPEH